MPVLAIAVVVLLAWGAGAAVGSASSYLVGALAGVAIVVVLAGVLGGISARRHPPERPEPLRSF